MGSRIADATIKLTLRRRAEHRRRVRTVVALAAAVAVLGGSGWLFGFSPWLSVQSVRVEGATLLTSAQVEGAARVPIGAPMATVDLDAIADRVAALPPTSAVTVHRAWPRTVVISITQRTAAVQRRVGSGYQWVDRSGTVFHVAQQPVTGLVTVECATADPRLLKDSATVAASLTGALRTKTTLIRAESPDDLVVVLTDGRQVVWGSAADSPTKAQVATALLGVKASVYNVSSPANPTSR